MPPAPPARLSAAFRLASRAWALLHADSARAIDLALQVLSRPDADAAALARAQLVIGYHHLYLSTPDDAIASLQQAHRACSACGDRVGEILAEAGIARAWWRMGRTHDAHQRLLALRDEGLQLLRHDQRGVLLNFISGSHSTAGEPDQVFAYMHSALRESRLSRQPGSEAVQHCNLSHELLQLGDAESALLQADEGLERCRALANPRLLSALLINRLIALAELGRAAEALPDVRAVCAVPPTEQGRGRNATHFETLAIVALRAGDADLGGQLVATAAATLRDPFPDERHEMAQARALLSRSKGDPVAALQALQDLQPWLAGDDDRGMSLRVRCSGLQLLADLHEQLGQSDRALAALRLWQRWQTHRAALASRARYQAVALETELMRLRRRLQEQEQRREENERARSELQAINEQLSRKVVEVEQLQEALREQATRDALTGLFNRRHLNDAMPTLFAMARRDGQPLAVALIDLDHFKAVNDEHGHDAGDQVLAAFATLLQHATRDSDVACRYGGEEFCLLMPNTPAQAALRKVEDLLQRWCRQAVLHRGLRLSGLGFTAGVCDSLADVPSSTGLLNAADQALLAGKRGGRRQVRLASPPSARDAAA